MRYVSGWSGLSVRAIAGLFLLGAASVASAQEGSFYFGAGVGQAELETDDDDFKSDDTGFKLFGGFDITNNFGIDIAYVDGGTIEEGGIEVETNGIQASLLGQVPITDQFSLFGRVGVFFWETETSVFGVTDDLEGEDAFFGLGGAFKVGQGFELRLEYNLGEIKVADFDSGTKADFSTFLISGVYRFE